MWDQLQSFMKIYEPEWEDKGRSEYHMNRRFMVNAYKDSEI